MTLTLKVNANDPPVDALIIAEIINCEKKTNIIVSWCDEWKIDGNLQLTGSGDNELLAKSSNEVARYFGRTIATEMYGSMDLCARTEVDHWLSFAIGPLKQPQLKEDTLLYLDRILTTNTWLVDKKLTIADISIFGALVDVSYLEKFERQYPCITRWYRQMLSLPAVGNALSSIKKNKLSTTVNRKSHVDDAIHRKMGARKQEGKFVDLPGAEMGKVVVRFPPEASGYLHIGHAKAALLNQYYAETFQGQLIMRFDDTNPAKESLEFEEAILEDIRLLNIKPDRFTYTSDYFDLILHYCTKLIKDDKAYVDDTPALLMKEQRDQKLISVNRNNPVAKNLQLWEEMQKGSSKGQECCVRAKIDYQSANGCLRDPTIYRCKPEPHPRTGTKYKVYPTYDFACPIVDSVENVTHTLRTTEYHDRDAQYYWIIDALGIRRPYIWEYSRLNMTNTVLSKRKLTWFVEQGLVDGWDDPRFPTVRGILRRGMTVEGLKQFIIAQGSSRSVVFMEWDKIWAFNKKVIDPIAVRYTALEYGQTVSVNVLDAKEEWLTVQNHPKDPSRGTKRVLVSPKVFIEKCDAEALVEGQNATFVNWGNLMIIKVHKKGNVVESVDAKLNLEDKNYKNTLKLTWLPAPSFDKDISCPEKELIPCYAVYFDHIISKPLLGKDDDFKNFITKDTRKEIQLLGETEMKRVQEGEIIQLQRKGFFRCDVPYAATSPFSSKEQPLILFHVPDGHAMSTNPANSSNSTSTTAKSDATEQTKQEDTNAINEQILSQGDKVRRLKAEKADKATIDAEVKILVNLKAKYKASSGREWKANSESIKGSAKDKSSGTADVADSLSGKITQCTSKIKELQASIDAQMRNLAQLKAEYRNSTGKSWEDEFFVTATQTEEKNEPLGKKKTPSVDKLLDEIQQQGDKVRQLKAAKADKSTIDAEVKVLLSLKADYKAVTGEEWKAGVAVAKAKAQVEDNNNLCEKIAEQGDKVRRLKNEKVSKTIIDEEVKVLLNLKADYKAVTGRNWEPGKITTKTAAPTEKRNVEVLSKEIETQGEKVRQLKSAKADQSIIEQQVQVLLRLKNDYKSMSGEEWKSQQSEMATSRKKKKEESIKCVKKFDNETTKSRDTETSKTGTRLGLEVRKEENFADWYSQVITKSGMIEYYDVSGCYILRPWSFTIWKTIKEHFDKQITKLGVQECYFPMFVTHAALEQEKTHIADFAPEVAWVTRCGDSDMAEPIAIRPTSETVMYPAYSKWLRSDTELPLRLNQWNNVVRWEFKDPKPFLRTREFLWQEGHSAFASKSEAEQEVLLILDLYANVYEDLLAVPVVKGRKTEKEKFAGGDYTTTVEAFIPTSGRGIQGATSHHLGQNFSKMFNIQIEGATEGEDKCYVYQNSWGMTTRTIGVMIMVHGDDKGLVLPPAVASIQAIIVPCGITATTTPQQRESLMLECTKLENDLNKNESLRVKADYRSNRTPGWKFNHWELKGVPVRIELGPKDLEKNQVTFVRRDNHEKVTASREKAVEFLRKLLTEIQADMLTRARKDMHDHIKQVENWSEFSMQLNKKNLILSPFCGEPSCEENIKADSAKHNDNAEEVGTLAMGAKSLCIPFDQPKSTMPLDRMKCIHPSCQNKPKFYTLFGRSY